MSVKAMLAAAQNHAFAEFVNNRMREVGILTVTQLAVASGVKPSTAFRALLKGEARAAPKTVIRIAKALGVESGVLFKLRNTPPRRMIEGPPARQEMIVPGTQVTLPKPPSFSMASTPGGMHIKLDTTVPFDQAFKLLDVLRAIGMFAEGA
jgi:plasmid maintenance system antidote protein VapI